MARIENFLFFQNDNTDEYSNVLNNIDGKALILEVSGDTIDIVVECKMDNTEENWTCIGGIDMQTWTKCETFATTGKFLIPIVGMSSIRVKNNLAPTGVIRCFGRVES